MTDRIGSGDVGTPPDIEMGWCTQQVVGINEGIDRFCGTGEINNLRSCSAGDAGCSTALRYFSAEIAKGVIGTVTTIPLLLENPLVIVRGILEMPVHALAGVRRFFDANTTGYERWALLGMGCAFIAMAAIGGGKGQAKRLAPGARYRVSRELLENPPSTSSHGIITRIKTESDTVCVVHHIPLAAEQEASVRAGLAAMRERGVVMDDIPLKETVFLRRLHCRIDSARLAMAEDGSVALSMTYKDGTGSFRGSFAPGLPAHRFLVDNGNLWTAGAGYAGYDAKVHYALAQVAATITRRRLETVGRLGAGMRSPPVPAIQGQLGYQVQHVFRFRHRDTPSVFVIFEREAKDAAIMSVLDPSCVLLSRPCDGWLKLTHKAITPSEIPSPNSSLLIQEGTEAGKILAAEYARTGQIMRLPDEALGRVMAELAGRDSTLVSVSEGLWFDKYGDLSAQAAAANLTSLEMARWVTSGVRPSFAN